MLETIHECWDEDPEARLPAANVLLRTEELANSFDEVENNVESQENTTAHEFSYTHNSGDGNNTNSRGHAHVIGTRSCFDELPLSMQAPPPPYYSGHHLSGDGSSLIARRPRFQSSMPHLDSGSWMDSDRHYGYCEPPAYGTRSFRNSVVVEGAAEVSQSNMQDKRGSNSVRNSLILGGPAGIEENAISVYERVLDTLSSTGDLLDQDHHTEETTLDNELESDHINSDSGYQVSQPTLSGINTNGSEFTSSLHDSHQSFNEDSTDTLSAPHAPSSSPHIV